MSFEAEGRIFAPLRPIPSRKAVPPPPPPKTRLPSTSGHSRQSQPAPELITVNPDVPANSITSLDDITNELIRRADALDISRSTIDAISGLQEGYSGKLLSANGSRRLGAKSLPLILDALAVRLVLVQDHEAFRRNKNLYVRRDAAHTLAATKGHAANPKPPRRRRYQQD